MKHLIILTFIIVFIFFGHNLGYDANSPWWTHITYNFQHANIMHLLLNSVSFFYIFRALERHIRPIRIALISLLIAFSMSFFCIYDQTVVGASGMVYAMIGMYFALITQKLRKRKSATLPFHKGEYREAGRGYKIPDPTPIIIFASAVAVSLTLSFIKENSAGLLHLLCLIGGFAIQYLQKLITQPCSIHLPTYFKPFNLFAILSTDPKRFIPVDRA